MGPSSRLFQPQQDNTKKQFTNNIDGLTSAMIESIQLLQVLQNQAFS
jgi:hypothetical protein